MMAEAGSLIINTRKRSDQVREQIEALIRDGSLRPGQKLPTEGQLMEMFGVGRSSVRAAVQSLLGVGLVEMRPGTGAYVRQLSTDDVAQVVTGRLALAQSAALHLMEARVMVEVTAARLAAERRTAADLQAMAQALESYERAGRAGDPDTFVDADIDFHAAMVRATHNTILDTMLASIAGILRAERLRRAVESPVNIDGAVSQHEQIYTAIVDGDAKLAAARVSRHLRYVETEMQMYLHKMGDVPALSDDE
jgi:GntR family transcriptional regulator, transcriptional repressor for pyruvate dehydrogenase complex